MSGNLETSHRDYRIRYDQNADLWRCYDLDLEAATLSALKDKINKQLLRTSKETAVRGLLITNDYGTPAIPLIEAEIREYKGSRTGYSGKGVIHDVVAFYTRATEDRPRRNTANLADFCHATPENQEKIAEANRLKADALLLIRQAEQVVQSIPRLTLDDISDLKGGSK